MQIYLKKQQQKQVTHSTPTQGLVSTLRMRTAISPGHSRRAEIELSCL